ncbi:UNVERIFIED_CONTAM: hypothetical protein ODX46_02765, partial [Salmonella enterica subsp. enterica serovar Enteritidis]
FAPTQREVAVVCQLRYYPIIKDLVTLGYHEGKMGVLLALHWPIPLSLLSQTLWSLSMLRNACFYKGRI